MDVMVFLSFPVYVWNVILFEEKYYQETYSVIYG
jgi:hypothetical protein